MRHLIVVASLLVISISGPVAAETSGRLVGPVAQLEPFLGTWEVRDTWSFGQTIWARSSYVPGPAGKTVLGRVLVKDGDGTPYVRYLSVFSYDEKAKAWKATTTNHDGTVTSGEFALDNNVMTTEWTDGGNTISDRTEVKDGKMHWLVRMAPEGTEEFQTLLDATWQRPAGDALITPIDANLFDPNPQDHYVVEQTFDAPVEQVFAAWTKPEDFRQAYAPDWKDLGGNFDLVIGGRYEILWDGITGSNDCQILSFIPNRMLSFSWNAPPDQKDSRAQRTWVVVEFEPVKDNKTHVRLTHLGFGEEPHWQKTREYFQQAWVHVLRQFQENFAKDA